MLKSFLAAASLVTQATTLSPDSPECEAIERAIENEDYIGTEEITAYLKNGEKVEVLAYVIDPAKIKTGAVLDNLCNGKPLFYVSDRLFDTTHQKIGRPSQDAKELAQALTANRFFGALHVSPPSWIKSTLYTDTVGTKYGIRSPSILVKADRSISLREVFAQSMYIDQQYFRPDLGINKEKLFDLFNEHEYAHLRGADEIHADYLAAYTLFKKHGVNDETLGVVQFWHDHRIYREISDPNYHTHYGTSHALKIVLEDARTNPRTVERLPVAQLTARVVHTGQKKGFIQQSKKRRELNITKNTDLVSVIADVKKFTPKNEKEVQTFSEVQAALGRLETLRSEYRGPSAYSVHGQKQIMQKILASTPRYAKQ